MACAGGVAYGDGVDGTADDSEGSDGWDGCEPVGPRPPSTRATRIADSLAAGPLANGASAAARSATFE